ncbi:MAG: 2'-5' RNA ligase family protein [Planctomycetota bacterium]|jgi:2'-5' RNA ligase
MGKIAIDTVLLPDEAMMDRAIEANRQLVEEFGRKIVLDKQTCLPHISLAMGCIHQDDIATALTLLAGISQEISLPQLTVISVRSSTNAVGETVSTYEVENTEQLQLLHERVMETLAPYLTSDVTAQMLYEPAEVSDSTLLWIKNYREKSSFAKFFPHITVGYGRLDGISAPVKFSVSKLALCHLGNHCTCRKVLGAIAAG